MLSAVERGTHNHPGGVPYSRLRSAPEGRELGITRMPAREPSPISTNLGRMAYSLHLTNLSEGERLITGALRTPTCPVTANLLSECHLLLSVTTYPSCAQHTP
jgi:hypothetical protein